MNNKPEQAAQEEGFIASPFAKLLNFFKVQGLCGNCGKPLWQSSREAQACLQQA